ncbi:hypothetical protein BN873_20007 [Candidatus Competibacter denitrificans Run_A_D11]|uniref:Uncharacterized protein n=1 Tax=Candidatus Competibacter denitrificans Run_A_D11 TaxID=1400863 RepID=W6MC44_9GAMM|nr:hypothetical protein BN873_20007 [Candidatus Competibacter denitrificans Run_A_D11]
MFGQSPDLKGLRDLGFINLQADQIQLVL